MVTRKNLSAYLLLIFGVVLVCAPVVWTNPASFSPAQMQQADPSNGQNQQTWTGTIKKDDSGKIVLVTEEGKTFKLTPEEQVASMVDKAVKVTGTLKGDVITVTSVEPMG